MIFASLDRVLARGLDFFGCDVGTFGVSPEEPEPTSEPGDTENSSITQSSSSSYAKLPNSSGASDDDVVFVTVVGVEVAVVVLAGFSTGGAGVCCCEYTKFALISGVGVLVDLS
jgi:hypothetical protein